MTIHNLIRGGALALLLSACASGGGGPGYAAGDGGHGDAQAYLGQWTFSTGEVDMTCADGSRGSASLAGSTVQIVSPDGAGIVMSSPRACAVRFAVGPSGEAMLVANQTCTVASGAYTAHETFQEGGLQIIAGKLDYWLHYAATVTGNGRTADCTYTQNGSASRR